jgi:hypothetical protein
MVLERELWEMFWTNAAQSQQNLTDGFYDFANHKGVGFVFQQVFILAIHEKYLVSCGENKKQIFAVFLFF